MNTKEENVFVLGYRGLRLSSQLIKLWTWGQHSHTALTKSNGATIEAQFKGGVQFNLSPWSTHKNNTPVDVFKLNYSFVDQQAVWRRARSTVGEDYDIRALLGFIPVLRLFWKDSPVKWFCSHHTAFCCHFPLLRGVALFNSMMPLYKLTPSFCVASGVLMHIGTVHNIYEFRELTSDERFTTKP